MNSRNNRPLVLDICFGPGASTSARIAQIVQAIETSFAESTIRCITVRGSGDVFLAGAVEGAEKDAFQSALERITVPLILAVNGACGGIGMDLLRYADMVIASEHAQIEGYETAALAARAFEINEVVGDIALFDTLNWYTDRLVAIPQPLISFGRKLYFALEKLPDHPTKSKYGASVIDEIMKIEASLNALHPKLGCGQADFDCEPGETISYRNEHDRNHAVLFEVRDDVAYLQLNAPQNKNKFDWRSSMELAGFYALANSIPTLKAIVVTGVGGWFHLGGMRYDEGDLYERERFADQLAFRNRIMRSIRVPLISAVNGECSGGGMSLVLKSDLIIAAESATFGYPEVKHNSFPCNSMVNTMDIIPKKAALKFFYCGELFSAREAAALGIVHRVVPDHELNAAVEQALREL